jgi:hypothetical protein
MTTPGYADYARLSQAGGTELAFAIGLVKENFIMFKGYVGAYPYVNLFLDMSTGYQPMQMLLEWYSDATFTNIVGFRFVNRVAGNLSATQYANLSPWLRVYYVTPDGSEVSFATFGLYGATAPALNNQLISNDVPLSSGAPTIAAGAIENYPAIHVQPGDAQLIVTTAASAYFFVIQYWNYSDNQYDTMYQFDQPTMGAGGSFNTPMIDAPINIRIHNEDAAAQQFTWAIISNQ